jgi:hypothetical protein
MAFPFDLAFLTRPRNSRKSLAARNSGNELTRFRTDADGPRGRANFRTETRLGLERREYSLS